MGRQKKINPAVLYFPAGIQEKLCYLRQYPLTVIHAPAGFGKSTALRRFFEQNVSPSTPVLWHTFLARQPSASWRSICALIGQADRKCADELAAIGLPDSDVLPELAEALENLECSEETYLVLDSFELSGLPTPETLLELFSKQGSEGLHIVVVTRELAASVLLSNHRVYRLEAADFTFSAADTEGYFRLAGLDVARGQALAVHQATGVWVLALHMQIMAYLKSGAFSSADTYQLIQQVVWDGLTDAARELFLSVSILPHFTLSQAVSLTGQDVEQTEQLMLEQAAFVHFDEETHSFYLHTIFAAFLRNKFQLLPEARRKAIYLAAGDLSAQTGDRTNTLQFYYYSGAWEKLLALPLTSYDLADVLDETTKPMIVDVVEHTPYEIKARYPFAMVPLAFTLFFLHENEKLVAASGEIERIIRESELSQRQKNRLLGEMELLLSFLEYNRIDAMSRRHRRALELLRGPAALINTKSTWTFGSPSILYMYWRETGKLSEELEQMDACMPIYYRLTQGHGTGAEHIMRAEAQFLHGETEEAEVLCHRALFAADTRHQNSIYLCGLFLLARIALLRGDKALFQNAVQSIAERSRQNAEDLCRYTQDLCLGYLHTLLGNDQAVAPWLAEGEITDRRLVVMTQPFAYIVYGRCLLRRREYRKLLGACQHMTALSSIFPNLLSQLYAKLYFAQALEALGKHPEAQAALQEALDMALPDGVLFPFAENYDGLRSLLPGVVSSAQRDDLSRIEALAGQLDLSLGRLQSTRPELSPREREVYELIRAGVTGNRELAETLHVSVATVKTLLGRIYEKTGVSSKTHLVLSDL